MKSRCLHVSQEEVLVASDFVWPGRGLVRCDATPLLTASLRALGLRVRQGPMNLVERAKGKEADVWAVSYVDRAERAAGFAVAAHPPRAEVVGTVVERWFQALRSRRLVIAAHDSCCEWRGTLIPEERAQPGDLTVPVQGTSEEATGPVARPGYRTVDTVCPLVGAAASDVLQYAQRGDSVVLVGRRGASTTNMLMGLAPGRTVLVEDVAAATAADGLDPDRVSFVVQPGMPLEEALPTVAALRERFPRLRGHHFSILCQVGSDRLAAVRSASHGSDLALVLGRPEDDDARALARAGESSRVRVISRLDQVTPEMLSTATTIAMAPARSMPAGLDITLRRALSGLGPLAVSLCTVRTHHLEAKVDDSSRLLPVPEGLVEGF